MVITLKMLKKVWSKKPNANKIDSLKKFNKRFGYKVNNSIRRRLGDNKVKTIIPTAQFAWFVKEFELIQKVKSK